MLFDLIIDIKMLIIDYLPCHLWVWFAINDQDVAKYSLSHKSYYIEKYTEVSHIVTKYRDETTWKMFGKLHREPLFGKSRPAISNNYSEEYYQNDKLHREQQPGETEWPAVVKYYLKKYYYHGQRHREENGIQLAAVIDGRTYGYDCGCYNRCNCAEKYQQSIKPFNEAPEQYTLKFYSYGKLHRDDDQYDNPQPSIIWKLYSKSEFTQHGKYYRSDGGPVIVDHDTGDEYYDYKFQPGEKHMTYNDILFTTARPVCKNKVSRRKSY